jgi:hypothetical protein
VTTGSDNIRKAHDPIEARSCITPLLVLYMRSGNPGVASPPSARHRQDAHLVSSVSVTAHARFSARLATERGVYFYGLIGT